jgi:hypothetical protein
MNRRLPTSFIEGAKRKLREVVIFGRQRNRDEILPNRSLNGTAPYR